MKIKLLQNGRKNANIDSSAHSTIFSSFYSLFWYLFYFFSPFPNFFLLSHLFCVGPVWGRGKKSCNKLRRLRWRQQWQRWEEGELAKCEKERKKYLKSQSSTTKLCFFSFLFLPHESSIYFFLFVCGMQKESYMTLEEEEEGIFFMMFATNKTVNNVFFSFTFALSLSLSSLLVLSLLLFHCYDFQQSPSFS